MKRFSFVEKSRMSFLVFDGGDYFGEVEQVGDDWVFHARGGLGGSAYAFGCCPADALENWLIRNRKGRGHIG